MIRYYRSRTSRGNVTTEEIDRRFALQMLSGGRDPGPAAFRRLEALEAGEHIDRKWSLGFQLSIDRDGAESAPEAAATDIVAAAPRRRRFTSTAWQVVTTDGDGSVARSPLYVSPKAAQSAYEAAQRRAAAETTVELRAVETYPTKSESVADVGDGASGKVDEMAKVKANVKKAASSRVKPGKPAPAKRRKGEEAKPKRGPETKASSNGHAPALDLVELEPGTKLRAQYGGKSLTATVGVDDAGKPTVGFKGNAYGSLSGAARAAIVAVSGPETKSRANGRTFWRLA